MFGDAIECAADKMAERVTPEYVHRDQHDVHRQNDGADADAETVREPARLPLVPNQKTPDDVGEPQKVAMKILKHQREPTLAQILVARLAHRAGRRVRPERLVVSAPVVITGEPETARDPKDQERGRKRQETGKPGRLRPEPSMRRVAPDFRRIKRRDIRTGRVVGILERGPRGVHQKGPEAEEN